MLTTPSFYFIVGPNGAGKSTFSEAMVPPHTVVINGDEIKELFPHLAQAAKYYDELIS
ncbi:MAG: hypothetical protein EAS52_13910 [Parapedobacter sp.]|nr:MAG: hypothetical protein EAS52_13910 [Parapedobacter sp.]